MPLAPVPLPPLVMTSHAAFEVACHEQIVALVEISMLPEPPAASNCAEAGSTATITQPPLGPSVIVGTGVVPSGTTAPDTAVPS